MARRSDPRRLEHPAEPLQDLRRAAPAGGSSGHRTCRPGWAAISSSITCRIASACSGSSHDVGHQDEVGHEPAGAPDVDRAHPVDVGAAATAVDDQRGQHEPVADHDLAAFQGRAHDGGHVLGAVGGRQQRGGLGFDGAVEQFAHPLPGRRVGRLGRRDDGIPAPFELGRQQGRVRGGRDGVDAVDGQTSSPVRSG